MRIVSMWSSWLLLALTLLVAPAHAGLVTFDFMANDGSYSVTGVMTVADVPSPVSNGQTLGFDILDISGFVTGFGGGAITGLVPNPNQPNPAFLPGYIYNNIYYPFGQTFDILGVLFTTGGGINWNFWVDNDVMYNFSSAELLMSELGVFTSTPPTLDPGPPPGGSGGGTGGGTIPEPNTALLLLIGLIGFTLVAHRKQHKVALLKK